VAFSNTAGGTLLARLVGCGLGPEVGTGGYEVGLWQMLGLFPERMLVLFGLKEVR
jgi:hypothetical protein